MSFTSTSRSSSSSSSSSFSSSSSSSSFSSTSNGNKETRRRPIRVLGLPGYATNAEVLKGKLKATQAMEGDNIELVTMDPPELLRLPTLPHADNGQDDGSHIPTSGGVTENAKRWWNWLNHRVFAPGELDTVVRALREFYEQEGPFDAVFGFSQGAAASNILLSLLENPHLHPIWSAPPQDPANSIEWPPKPVKAAVLVAAFGPTPGWGFRGYEEGKPETPVLHVIGKNDVVVDNQHTLDTAAWNQNSTVVWHDGGHHIPRKAQHARLIRDFLVERCAESPSLSSSASSSDCDSSSSDTFSPPLSPTSSASEGKDGLATIVEPDSDASFYL